MPMLSYLEGSGFAVTLVNYSKQNHHVQLNLDTVFDYYYVNGPPESVRAALQGERSILHSRGVTFTEKTNQISVELPAYGYAIFEFQPPVGLQSSRAAPHASASSPVSDEDIRREAREMSKRLTESLGQIKPADRKSTRLNSSHSSIS